MVAPNVAVFGLYRAISNVMLSAGWAVKVRAGLQEFCCTAVSGVKLIPEGEDLCLEVSELVLLNTQQLLLRNEPDLIGSPISLTVEQTGQEAQWKRRLSGCAAIQPKAASLRPALYVVVRSYGLYEDTPR